MAFKGTAGKSSSGASMSKYDVEVEARLVRLEQAVAELQSHTHDEGSTQDVAGVVKALKEEFPAKFANL